MAAFDHVMLLLSFVYALAIAHVLSRVGELALARDRVRFSPVLALWVLNAFLLVYSNWLFMWNLHTVKTWDLGRITALFVFSVGNYFVCSVIMPDAREQDGEIDLQAFFWRQRKLFYSALLFLDVLAMLTVIGLLFTKPLAFLTANLVNLMATPMVVLPMLIRVRWVQWAGGILFFLLYLDSMVAFVPSLG